MDERTTMRELDEVIARSKSATEREAKLLEALPACGLRKRKQKIVRQMRDYLYRLQGLRTALKTRRRPGIRLN